MDKNIKSERGLIFETRRSPLGLSAKKLNARASF